MDNSQGRVVRPLPRGSCWARRAITLAVLAAGMWSVTASRAAAGPTLIVRQFMCPVPIVGTQTVTVTVVRPTLDTATVGVPTPRLQMTATATVAAAARLAVSFLGAKWAEGTGVIAGEADTPQGPDKRSMPFTVPRTDVATGSGPLSVPGFGTLPSMTFSRPGAGHILVTRLTLHLILLTSSGEQTILSPFNITCTLAPGQSDAVASFRILPASPAPSPHPSHGKTTKPPTPRPTSHTPSPAPSHVTARPPDPPKPSSATAYLLWLVGIVVGGLAGVSWWLLHRMTAPRRAK